MHSLLRPSTIALATATLMAVATASLNAATYDLEVGETTLDIDGKARRALGINGGVPGPTLRFKEGEDLVINVTNRLDEDTSIHWHGLILPNDRTECPGLTLRRHRAWRDLHLPLSRAAERHLLVPQPFRPAGAGRASTARS